MQLECAALRPSIRRDKGKLSDGGCINVESVYLRRRCIGDQIPFVRLVKTKRCGKAKVEAMVRIDH